MAEYNITVNGIAPGVVRTPLWDGLEQDMIDRGVIKQKGEFIESFSAGILLGRPSLPADLSGICAFLASAESDYITRSNHHVRWRYGIGVKTSMVADLRRLGIRYFAAVFS